MDTALIISLLILGYFTTENECQTSLCKKPNQPINGQVFCINDSGTLKCYATCNGGFTFQTTSVEFRTCNQADGSWPSGNTFPDCIDSGSRCRSLSPPKNGVVRCESVNTQLVCIAECDRQYVFPTGQTALKKVCNASVGWQSTDRIPDCKASCSARYLISGSTNITDSDFTTSSILSENQKTFSPRKSDIFCVNECGWRPSRSDLNQFVQINLQRAGRLLGITTKGLSVGPSELYVTRFRILHSMDGKVFTPYSDANVTDKFFSGNTDGYLPKMQVFSCPFEAQYIRINPLEWHDGIGLRFDLLGCDIDSLPKTTVQPHTPPQRATTISTQSTPQPATGITSGATGKTTLPQQPCSPVLPPPNGVVNCQKTTTELSCTAICNDGFQFTTTQSLIRLTCQLQTGTWSNGKNFPACIAVSNQVITAKPSNNRKCVSSQSDCNVFGNGDYNTCGDCRYFATCSDTLVYIRSCPNNLSFDSVTGTCQFISNTCRSSSRVPFG
ncbi:lactadherin-like isoform X1 [Mytilus trossulus]|uniref:lactadherin-like isoform X1 n=1 Tax=Mytilus trossulus TaxID=6551 RepID=UPI00300744BA